MSNGEDTAVVPFRLNLGDRTMEATVRVPAGPVPLQHVLPVLHQFDDALMSAAQTRHGKPVSCQAGCGACCRQLAPVSEVEARYLYDQVESFEEPRRSAVRERFRAGLERLAEAGLLERIKLIPQTAAEREALAMEYFRLGVACPFLEEESCSIHPTRPMICREYLVTSPAAACASPSPENIERVPTHGKGSQVLCTWVQGAPRYLPLILALDWIETNPGARFPIAPGPQFVRAFVRAIEQQLTTD